MKSYYIRNCDIKRILIGVPRGHRHLRVALETENFYLVFSEALIANIVRAYISVKTHPTCKAIELSLVNMSQRGDLKDEFSPYQHLEKKRDYHEIENELFFIMKESKDINDLCSKVDN